MKLELPVKGQIWFKDNFRTYLVEGFTNSGNLQCNIIKSDWPSDYGFTSFLGKVYNHMEFGFQKVKK